MIRVDNDYFIEIDQYEYTVKRDTHKVAVKKDKITGEETRTPLYHTVGHFGGLTGALKGVLKDMNAKELAEGVHTLEESVAIVMANNKKLSDLLERALEV